MKKILLQLKDEQNSERDKSTNLGTKLQVEIIR